jgi:VCBS repeat-containing protein
LGLGHPSLGAGDGNYDGSVNNADFTLWKEQNGEQSAATFTLTASAASSTTVVNSVSGAGASAVVADAAFETSLADEAIEPSAAARELYGRPFEAAGETRAQRPAYRPAGQNAEAKLAEVLAQFAAADYLDRAFDDLFGSRRRQGLQAEVELLEAGDDIDCDEAFALLADHFDWTAG